jgi:hypothetical protein
MEEDFTRSQLEMRHHPPRPQNASLAFPGRERPSDVPTQRELPNTRGASNGNTEH